ncbi:unnamed protein product [Cuscuta campestris]|uniref:Amino acid transporter transmembrane domain-containing protein n=1 Tax=Cuscuta campestris TaxID=132261 RepID=A0A484LWV1_9ASTE|nr:unnamed protein product [Cuscuta campestris]
MNSSSSSVVGVRPTDSEAAADDDHDQMTAEQKEAKLNEWFAVTGSRNGNWLFSVFHNVTALVGAGVLGLPYAMAQLGWGPGTTILVLSWIITFFTLWQMVEMHEAIPGRRFNRYHELGQYAFGERLGLWIVVPQQLMVQVGTNIVYMVTGGKSLQKFYTSVWAPQPAGGKPIRTTYFIMIFGAVQLLLSHIPSFNDIAGVSIIAAIMSLSYSTIAWVASAKKGVQPDASYQPVASTGTGRAFGFMAALGDVAFAYAAHSVVLEIQATIKSTPEKPSKGPMLKGSTFAYIIVALCYFPVSIVGYYVFGNSVQDNILISLEKPRWLIAIANIFVFIHVVGSYQVFAVPVFDMLETYLVKTMKFKPSRRLRYTTRYIYVGVTMLIGMTFPFFGGLLSFFGGFAFAPTTYFIPCVMWLIIFKPKRFSLSWTVNWLCIILGVLLTILAPIGALRLIVIQSKSYKLFS